MSGFISYPYLIPAAVGGFVGGEALAKALSSTEPDAMGIDFTYHTDITQQMYIVDTATPANNYDSYPQSKLTYTSPSLKMTRQSDGVWRYVNHNLELRSQEFSNATWSKLKGTVTADSTTAPDGTSTADTWTPDTGTDSGKMLYRSAGPTITGGQVTMSVWVKPNGYTEFIVRESLTTGESVCFTLSGSGSVKYSSASTVSTSISLSGGWYRVAVTWVFAAGTAVASGFLVGDGTASSGDAFFASFTHNGTSGVYVWGAQIKRTPVNDALGFTYATGYLATTTTAVYDLPYEWNAAGVSQGILIEEQRTNLLTRSQSYDDASLSGNISSLTVTANNTIAPDSTTTAEKLTATGGNTNHFIYNTPTVVSGSTYAYSVFVKKGDHRYVSVHAGFTSSDYFVGTFDLDGGGSAATQTGAGTTGTLVSTSMTDAGSGWFRLTVVGVVNGTTPLVLISYASAATGNTYGGYGNSVHNSATTSIFYVWGFQYELGSFASSPIHTIAASVTRAADDISILTSAIPFSTTVGSVITYAQKAPAVVSSGNPYLWSINNGTTTFYFAFFAGSLATNIFFEVENSGTQAAIDPGSWAFSALAKIGTAWAANDFAAVIDGGTVGTDVSGTIPTVTNLQLGNLVSNRQFGGYIRQLTYLKRRVINTDLQTVTT